MNKQRISLTIDGNVLKKLDALVDGELVRSRSEAVEKILSAHLESNRVAVFLGGGDPSNLKINGVFRPLVDIGGQTLIEQNISRLKRAGFRRLLLVGSSELVGECFKVLGNGQRLGVEFDYLEETRPLGNAKTLQLVEGRVLTSFLVLPIDNFFTFDLDELVHRHSVSRGTVTLAVHASREDATDLGVVEMVGDNIVTYDEKPQDPRTYLTSVFIGMYEPRVFDYIPRGDVQWVLQNDLFPLLIKERQLFGCMVRGVGVNVHEPQDVARVRGQFEKMKNGESVLS